MSLVSHAHPMPAKTRQPDRTPFRLPRERSTRKSVLGALLLSAALHIPLLIALPSLLETHEALDPTEFDSRQEFTVSVVDEDKKPKQDKPDEDRKGQFVSMEAPDKEERPDEARFRDQYDSKADQEMVRHEPGRNNKPGPSHPDTRASQSRPQPQKPQHHPDNLERTPPAERPPKQAHQQQDRQTEAEPSQQEAAEDADEAVDLQEAEKARKGVESKSKPQADPSKLFPSLDSAQVASGGGRIDYLKNVPEGEKTLLNRKRSRYWSFMQRLKEQVVQEWSPGEEYRRRDPYGKVYGTKDRFTNLRITLNGDGSLRSIYVSNPSGLDFYDEEAVRAVRAAAPFPNPPEGMMDQDGLITINFGFLLDLSTGDLRDLRIFR